MARDPNRPLRADAQRNRDKILSTAVRLFSEQGLDATFDQIAKEAGVGAGTLYRNFPTREALIEAAYRSELARLCDSAAELLAVLPPDEALRAWMDRFIDYVTTKRGMADALRAVIDAGGNPRAQSRELMIDSVATVLQAGVAAESPRPDIQAGHHLPRVTGVALSS